ncbi:MAG: hypothetical protein GWN16_14940 [Calditrichae bacterium]|nr:hypothetical protein [Calditrichia bacterium]
MKMLYLVRHAKAVSRDLNLKDFDRALVKKGKNDAQKMAENFINHNSEVELLVSSPAKRALSTAKIFAKTLKYPSREIQLEEKIYSHNSAESLLDVVRSVDDKYDSVMVFGHDPGFSEFARFLAKDFQDSMSKSAVVGFKLNNNSWGKISKSRGQVVFYDYPNKEKKKWQKMSAQLEDRIVQQLTNTFQELNGEAANTMGKPIKKASEKLTQKFIKRLKSLPHEESTTRLSATKQPNQETESTSVRK